MRDGLKFAAGVTVIGAGLIFLDWFLRTSVEAGTLLSALAALFASVAGLGLLAAHNRAETRREAARERRYQAAELRARLAEESEAWRRERGPWN